MGREPGQERPEIPALPAGLPARGTFSAPLLLDNPSLGSSHAPAECRQTQHSSGQSPAVCLVDRDQGCAVFSAMGHPPQLTLGGPHAPYNPACGIPLYPAPGWRGGRICLLGSCSLYRLPSESTTTWLKHRQPWPGHWAQWGLRGAPGHADRSGHTTALRQLQRGQVKVLPFSPRPGREPGPAPPAAFPPEQGGHQDLPCQLSGQGVSDLGSPAPPCGRLIGWEH